MDKKSRVVALVSAAIVTAGIAGTAAALDTTAGSMLVAASGGLNTHVLTEPVYKCKPGSQRKSC